MKNVKSTLLALSVLASAWGAAYAGEGAVPRASRIWTTSS